MVKELVLQYTWKEAYIAGLTSYEEIDDWIDYWHDEDSWWDELYQLLGLGIKEYNLFVENPQKFGELVGTWDITSGK